MLVLTRKSNQSIMIGDDIEVSVLSIMGEKVRIGIQAPQGVTILRQELLATKPQPQPPQPCGSLDLSSPLTQHCFPADGAPHGVCSQL